MHGNVTKPLLSERKSFEMRENAVKFIENFALTNALVLPGRTSGAKKYGCFITALWYYKTSSTQAVL